MNKIKDLRIKHQLTQEDMAKKLNISLRHYQNIELGKVTTNVKTALSIAKILNSTVEDLF